MSDSSLEQKVLEYKKAADKGNIDAMYNYAIMLENGEGVVMNKEEAVRYYKMAIDNENTNAMNNYAAMLENGDGIKKNEKEAIRYYKMAADKGHADAMYNYANILYEGLLTQKNRKEAAKYYKLAADNNDVRAMFCYAKMLNKGEGIPMDNKEAAKYCKMAADEGNFEAKKLLRNINKINFLKSKGYENPEKLGKGGFGEVYKMKKDGESYAVKIPIIKEGNVKTFKQLKKDKELQTLIDLSGGGHTKKIDEFNIMEKGEKKIYQIEILKLREKDDLSKILESKKNIPKISFISQLAVAYKKLHSNGIVHGDIKPENVLFNKENKKVKTADYGLSGIGKIDCAVGTPFYMAPEVFNGYVDEKSDVYSMGIMFLEILTGKIDLDLMALGNLKLNLSNICNCRRKKIINNEKLKKLINRVSMKDLFSSINVDENNIGKIQEELVELITGMLEKDPGKRLSSNQVAEKCGEIFKICNLSKTELENCGIYDKDLYSLCIFDESTLECQKNKIKGDLELLQEENLIDPKKQAHLNTLTGKKKLSTECKNCLKNLSKCFTEDGKINLNLDNDEFKENVEKIRKSGNQREYLLIVNKILDIKELKMSNEIFRLEKIEKGIGEERQIEEKKEGLKKLKEERGLIMQEHIKLSRLPSNTKEKNRKAKEGLEKLVKVSEAFSSLEEKRGMEKS